MPIKSFQQSIFDWDQRKVLFITAINGRQAIVTVPNNKTDAPSFMSWALREFWISPFVVPLSSGFARHSSRSLFSVVADLGSSIDVVSTAEAGCRADAINIQTSSVMDKAPMYH